MHARLADRAFRLMRAIPRPGCVAEFGVFQGGGLSLCAKLSRKYLAEIPPLYGFDSFAGMPNSTVPLEAGCAQDWAPGTFNDTSLERVEARLQSEGIHATLVKGLFDELPPLSEYGIDKVRLAHIDADIYEGYHSALQLLTPHIQIGTVILFDESMPPTDYRYQSVRIHGKRAVEEWEQASGFNLHLIRFMETAALYVIVDEDYLRQFAGEIIHLRRPTIEESLRNIARLMSGRG